jgi:deoxyribodipyrimidine photolyase-related protein
VMVPNVYGMSQYADGGIITTKPYISSSNYIRKMSDFKEGPWCEVWDGLYWRFIRKHRDLFSRNPRMKVIADQLDRMDNDKLKKLLQTADRFLDHL